MTSSANAQDRVSNWHADIDFLVSELSAKHKNLYHKISESAFAENAQQIKGEISDIDDVVVMAKLSKLVASVGDGHTSIVPNYSQLNFVPLQFYWFKDGIYITSATSEYSEAFGGRVTKFGAQDISTLFKNGSEYLSHDNQWQLRGQFPRSLGTAEFLFALGAWSSTESGTIEYEKNGKLSQIRCKSLKRPELQSKTWVSRTGPKPFFAKKSNLVCWNDLVPGTKLMFFKYNACRDQTAFNRLVNGSIGYVKQNPNKIDGFVLDLRDNGGGNSAIFNPLLNYLKTSPFNKKGKLFVITSRKTFSSAVLNAMAMKSTNAIFVGEPTGGKPNHFGEVKTMVLPNSKMAISYSTKFFRRISASDPPAVMPDVEIAPTYDDWVNGRDPVIESIVERYNQK